MVAIVIVVVVFCLRVYTLLFQSFTHRRRDSVVRGSKEHDTPWWCAHHHLPPPPTSHTANCVSYHGTGHTTLSYILTWMDRTGATPRHTP